MKNLVFPFVRKKQKELQNEAFEEYRQHTPMIHSEMAQPELLEVALSTFQQQYPTFASTHVLDELRATEYARLDRQKHVYLDYTGGGLYAERQLRDYFQLIDDKVFGNPHSTNPASQIMNDLVEQARRYVLDYFNASPEEYIAIFTANATAAVKLVAEAYPFAPGGQYLMTFDNHNAVNGVREFARVKGASVRYVPVEPPDMRVNEACLAGVLAEAQPGQRNLFAFPAQSNVTGVQHDLEWIARAQAQGWDVLLDAAAFVPSNRLDLSKWHPDFVPLSFYKIFGFPTGVGCLLLRKSALAKLRRPWFSGGTIVLSSVIAADEPGYGFYRTPGEAGFEDGTVNYLLLPAVEIGLRYIESIGIEVIHERVRCLTGWLLEQMLALYHSNGQPLVRIYGPTTTERRGGTIAFNFCDPDGAVLDCYAMQELANQYEISVRSGCFCNPGVREVALGFVREDLASSFREKERMTFEQFLHVIDNQKQGAVRVSLGLATTFADVYQFVRFLQTCIDQYGPLADKTIQPQQMHSSLNGRCVCGYQDHRNQKLFCPQCGRPMSTTLLRGN